MVSVIIPTYNRANYLHEAIFSVYEQTYRPIECIVVDDGSTDDTTELVKSLGTLQKDNFIIKYVWQENAGAQVARNRGIELASGDFIQYLDSDDLLYKDKLSNQVCFLEDHPEYDGVFGDWEIGLPQNKELIQAYKSDDLISQMLTDRCIHTLSILFRRRVYDLAGGWDPAIKRNQEIDFHIRSLLNGAKFDYQPLLTGLWRTHNEVRIANSTNLNDVVFFYRKMEKLLSDRHLFSFEMKRKISCLYMWLVSQNIDQSNMSLILAMKEAVRLYPEITFFKNKNLKMLAGLLGKDLAFAFWLRRFRKKRSNR